MSNNKKKPTTSIFYNETAMVEELYTGYLIKSPAQQALTKNTLSQKSWKHRFFVLSKTGEESYQLTYYANNERRDKPLGEIDLSKISLLFIGPEAHQKWDWIQKNFKCSPSSVLFLKVEDNTPKHSRDYFLIGKNSDDVDGWLNALVKVMKTQKSRNTLQDNRFRSASEPVKSSEPKVEDEPDERRSAPALMLTYPSLYSHYDYPRKLSEPLLPVALKFIIFDYLLVVFFSTSMNGHESSVCNGAIYQDEDDECKCETCTHVEEICVRKNDLKNSLILTQAEGKPCVSDCRKIQDSWLFHKGDQILAFNDLLIDTVEEIQTYVRRLSKDEVKLTIRRLIGSQPLHSEPCPS
uniref:Pleckstrin homology domain-containing family S member 1-like n=1 Tax=Sinocyclocheilus grahami TaxID=75366 RepID=A0A672MBC1_SINGR